MSWTKASGLVDGYTVTVSPGGTPGTIADVNNPTSALTALTAGTKITATVVSIKGVKKSTQTNKIFKTSK
jgi:hypothetical protein